AVDTELIAGLANRPDDVHDLGRALVETRQIQDLVMSAVERGSNQRVHAGRYADIVHFAFALELRHRCEQHTCFRDEIPPRLDPKGDVRVRRLERRKRLSEFPQYNARLAEALGHAEPTAQIDRADVLEARRKLRQGLTDLLPIVDAEYAAARVRMQADDSGAGTFHELVELLHLEQGDAEL